MHVFKAYKFSSTTPSSLIIISVTAVLKYPPRGIGINPLINAGKNYKCLI